MTNVYLTFDDGPHPVHTPQVLERALGRSPTLFRPPFGRMGPTTRADATAVGLETARRRLPALDEILALLTERLCRCPALPAPFPSSGSTIKLRS